MAVATYYLYSNNISITYTNEEYETFMLEVVNEKPPVKVIADWLKSHVEEHKKSFIIHAINLVSEDERIAGLLYRPQNPNGEAILFLHGWLSSKESMTEFAVGLSNEGYAALTFDFRGMGESEGDLQILTRKNYLADCLAAYDFLASQPDIKRVSVVGVSFGGYMAALLPKYREIHNMVMRAPANYPDEDFSQPQIIHSTPFGTKGWEADINQQQDTFAVNTLRQFAGNVLIVGSSNDSVIHPKTIQTFLDACRNKSKVVYKILEGAQHSISKSKQFSNEYRHILIEWFKES